MFYNYRFSRGDGAILIDKGDGRADEKLRGSLEAGEISFRRLPFISPEIPLPPRVIKSVMARHRAYWGRY